MREMNEANQKANKKIMSLLKDERERRNWTYEEVGAKLGVSASYIFRLEKGERANPSSKVIIAMCELFGLNPNEIFQLADTSGLKSTVIVNGKEVDMDLVQETMHLILNTDVDKMSEVNVLLSRIQQLQEKITNTSCLECSSK